jgi:hypothetical protein
MGTGTITWQKKLEGPGMPEETRGRKNPEPKCLERRHVCVSCGYGQVGQILRGGEVAGNIDACDRIGIGVGRIGKKRSLECA